MDAQEKKYSSLSDVQEEVKLIEDKGNTIGETVTKQVNSFDDTIENPVDPIVEAMEYDEGPDSNKEGLGKRAVKGVGWLLGLVGVFVICMLVVWMCNINKSPVETSLAASTMALKSPVTKVKSSLSGVTASIKQPLAATGNAVTNLTGKTASAVSSLASAATDATQKVMGGTAKAVADATQTMATSQADADRIEKEAMEVLHGQYGNNPGRAEKLGADYAQVQARVNQLLHM